MLRSRGTVLKDKTQTISVSTVVKKLFIKFLLFNDFPLYLIKEICGSKASTFTKFLQYM